MRFQFSDGGRSEAGYKGDAGDCVTRAIAIATERPYEEIRSKLMEEVEVWSKTSRSREAKKWASSSKGRSVRDGTPKTIGKTYLRKLGWIWTPTMGIGTGCTTHLRGDELPSGTLIVQVSKHLVCVKDGIIFDTDDPSRDGTRCVYGYWWQEDLSQCPL